MNCAKTSAVQAKAQDSSKARSRACGSKCLEWSASASQLTSSLRTRRCSAHGDSTLSSTDLPASGLMRRGTLYPQATSVRPTSESGCGFSVGTPTATMRERSESFKRPTLNPEEFVQKFPTPTATLGGYNKSGKEALIRPTLEMMARHQMWPTPTVNGNYNKKGLSKTSGDGLATAVAKLWPTPTARNCVSNCPSELQRNEPSLSVQAAGVGGKLNPRWVEWLMGWPIGWVSFDALATDRFQSWRQQRFDSFESD